MHQVVQAILHEDQVYQAKKNLLEEESVQRTVHLRSALESELAKLQSLLESKTKAQQVKPDSSDLHPTKLSGQIEERQKRILKTFLQKKNHLIAIISNHIIQSK